MEKGERKRGERRETTTTESRKKRLKKEGEREKEGGNEVQFECLASPDRRSEKEGEVYAKKREKKGGGMGVKFGLRHPNLSGKEGRGGGGGGERRAGADGSGAASFVMATCLHGAGGEGEKEEKGKGVCPGSRLSRERKGGGGRGFASIVQSLSTCSSPEGRGKKKGEKGEKKRVPFLITRGLKQKGGGGKRGGGKKKRGLASIMRRQVDGRKKKGGIHPSRTVDKLPRKGRKGGKGKSNFQIHIFDQRDGGEKKKKMGGGENRPFLYSEREEREKRGKRGRSTIPFALFSAQIIFGSGRGERGGRKGEKEVWPTRRATMYD